MRTSLLFVAALTIAAACAQTRQQSPSSRSSLVAAQASPASAGPQWSMNATIIEACSCPMFCQCYFNTEPASHPGCCPPGTDPKDAPRYCRFNNAFKVNEGTYAGTELDGLEFWVAGDLGGDFSAGEMDSAVLHFEPSATPEQRQGVVAILGALYPVKWRSFETGADLPIEWNAGKGRAVARLDGGKAAEVVLKQNQGMTDEPIVIRNLRYWGAPRNEGFVMMQNEVQAYRLGETPYEHHGTNGFMITLDIASKDVASASTKGY